MESHIGWKQRSGQKVTALPWLYARLRNQFKSQHACFTFGSGYMLSIGPICITFTVQDGDARANAGSFGESVGFSPHFCVGFLFLVLYPAASFRLRLLPPPSTHSLLTHTLSSHTLFTHNLLTHTLSSPTCHHTSCRHTTCSHTLCSHTPCPHQLVLTQLVLTHFVHTQLAHTYLVLTNLSSHNLSSHNLCSHSLSSHNLHTHTHPHTHTPTRTHTHTHTHTHTPTRPRPRPRPRPRTHAHTHTQLARAGVDGVDAAAFCVAGVTLLRHPPYFHVAGVTLGDTHLRFAWQAWHLVTPTRALRGRRGAG